MHEGTKVTLREPGLAGAYVLDEQRADGSLVLRPDTSAEAIGRRQGGRPMTSEELDHHFNDLLAPDGEG